MALFSKPQASKIFRNAAISLSRNEEIDAKRVEALVKGLEHEDIVLMEIMMRLRGDIVKLRDIALAGIRTGVDTMHVKDAYAEGIRLTNLAEAIIKRDEVAAGLILNETEKLEELFKAMLLRLGREKF